MPSSMSIIYTVYMFLHEHLYRLEQQLKCCTAVLVHLLHRGCTVCLYSYVVVLVGWRMHESQAEARPESRTGRQ